MVAGSAGRYGVAYSIDIERDQDCNDKDNDGYNSYHEMLLSADAPRAGKLTVFARPVIGNFTAMGVDAKLVGLSVVI